MVQVGDVAQGDRLALPRGQGADLRPELRIRLQRNVIRRRRPSGHRSGSGTSSTGTGRRARDRWPSIAQRAVIVISQERRLAALVSRG